MNWVQAVLEKFSGSDESKLNRLKKHILKYCEKQVDGAKEKLDEIKEKISDKQEELAELVLTVDVTKIASTEDSRDYAKVYIAAYDSKLDEIQELENELLDYQATIDRRTSQSQSLGKEDYNKK